MKLTVEDLRGVWRAQIDNRSEFGDTLEELLLQLAPDVPVNYVWAAAEVLGSVLGAEVVELERDYSAIADMVFDWNEGWVQEEE